jgi:hypothetical protein
MLISDQPLTLLIGSTRAPNALRTCVRGRSATHYARVHAMPKPSHEQLRAAFAVFDRDGSGALDADEMRAVLSRPVGGKVSAQRVEQVIKQFDKNGDGKIQIDECSIAIRTGRQQTYASPQPRVSIVVARFIQAFGSGSSDIQDPMTYWAQQMGAFPTVDYSDLVPDGAGCEIPKTEERGINLKQAPDRRSNSRP